MSILLVQHDAYAAQTVSSVLEEAGFRVKTDESFVVEAAAVDVVILGLAGGLDGRTRSCRRLRDDGYLGAIVAFTQSVVDVPSLLDAGADDFVVSPTAAELVLRVRLALRRAVARARTRWGALEVDRLHRAAYLRGARLPLTAREYALLCCLLDAAGEPVSRPALLLKVWGREEIPGTNVLEVHLSRLRDKLGEDASLVETVRRLGYRLRR